MEASMRLCRRLLRGFLPGLMLACASGLVYGQAVLHTVMGDSPGDEFGRSVSGAGDVDQDGFDDFVVGAPEDDNAGTNSGSVRVFSGKTGAILYSFDGLSGADELGWSVSSAGDIDQDGFDDVIAGSRFGDSGTLANTGSAMIYSGRTGAVLHTLSGIAPNDMFGWDVCGVGDLDGDGRADVLVGAGFSNANGTDSGSAHVFSGQFGSLMYTFVGQGPTDEFGRLVACADVDADGFQDPIVGAWHSDANGLDAGSTYVYSGATGLLLHQFNGDNAVDFSGIAAAGAGDVDADGFADVLVGAHHDDNNGIESGSAKVFSGATGAQLYIFNGDHPDWFFGRSVSAAGDVDRDGYADFVAGSPFKGNASSLNVGCARVYSGIDGHLIRQYDQDAVNDLFAFEVNPAGDVDGDAFLDVIIGARLNDANGLNAGSAKVFSGCNGDVEVYGSGCAGAGGFVPALDWQGCPNYGNSGTLRLTKLLGNAPVFLLVGVAPAVLPLPQTCTFLVDPNTLHVIPALATPGGPGAGTVTIATTLPLAGPALDVCIQGAAVDGNVQLGFALSNGLRLGLR